MSSNFASGKELGRETKIYGALCRVRICARKCSYAREAIYPPSEVKRREPALLHQSFAFLGVAVLRKPTTLAYYAPGQIPCLMVHVIGGRGSIPSFRPA